MKDISRILAELRPVLQVNIGHIAERLLGQPTSRGSSYLRWGNKGSLLVSLSGPYAGRWKSFEDGGSGDAIALIKREQHCSFFDAVKIACDFVGIDFFHEISPEDPAKRAARERKRIAEEAQRLSKANADNAKRIALANVLWRASKPITGTVAETYLQKMRAIPGPYPDGIRFHPQSQSLIVAGTDASGAVRFTHRICLTPTGKKIEKTTNGIMKDAYVRLPGPADGPLHFAEGVETGLSLWAATGYEIWLSIGSIGRHRGVDGRQCVFCRDDDKLQSPADQALKRAAGTSAVATPWDVRRQDTTDFNDVIQAGGVAAVRARIEAATRPIHQVVERNTADEGRAVLRQNVGSFYAEAPAWLAKKKALKAEKLPAEPPPVYAIKVDVGGGKTDISMQFIDRALSAVQAIDGEHTIVIAVPEHVLGDQQVQRLTAMHPSLTAAVWRSRRATLDDEPMCRDLDAVDDAEKALVDVQTSVCKMEDMFDGNEQQCRFFDTCLFQKQKEIEADVWFIPHELLFTPRKPKVIRKPAIVVVDESCWQDGITKEQKTSLSILLDDDAVIPGNPEGSLRLRDLREKLHGVLSYGGHASREAMLQAGLNPKVAAEAYGLEWKRKIKAYIFPDQPVEKRKSEVARVSLNELIRRFAAIWKAVEALTKEGGPEFSGWLSAGRDPNPKTKDDMGKKMFLKGRKGVNEAYQVPTLLMDATLQPDLLRNYWPTLAVTADVRLTAPHQHVTQVVDHAYSKGQVEKEKGLRDVHAILCREARRHAPGRVLAVVQKGVEEQLADLGPLPANLETGHHNAVAGKDGWGPGPDREGVVALIVVGRTEPAPANVEVLAESLTGVAVEHIEGWYPKANTIREMADGSVRSAEGSRHPNPTAELIRWTIAEGQLIQILGRARGVNRTNANPVDILVMCNTPLPIPVEQLIVKKDLNPSPADLMMAAGGVELENQGDASKVYPKLWATAGAAKIAFQRARGTSRPRPALARVTYQRGTAGCAKAAAWVDLATVPDPEAWLSERLGRLSYFATEGESLIPETRGRGRR
jgi:putative DNA primase/helicase